MPEVPTYVWLALTLLIVVKVAKEFLLLGALAKFMNHVTMEMEEGDE